MMITASITTVLIFIVILPTLVKNTCTKKENYELRLSVEGTKDLGGKWEKDAKLDFTGPPQSWNIDLEEKNSNTERFSFTAVARVLGEVNISRKLKELEPLYIYRGDLRNFSDAEYACKTIGANLAVINSDEEASYLRTLILRSRDPKSSNNYTYLGFHDNDREGFFITLQGKPLNESGYYRWAPNEPNNLRFRLPNNTIITENCGSMTLQGLLNDSACHIRLPFICEFDEPCESDDEQLTSTPASTSTSTTVN